MASFPKGWSPHPPPISTRQAAPWSSEQGPAVGFPDLAPPCAFTGELEKAVARFCVSGVAGEAAATLGLIEKVKRLRHRTHFQPGASPFGALSRRRLEVLAGNA